MDWIFYGGSLICALFLGLAIGEVLAAPFDLPDDDY